jgi:hypothetical protein
MSLTPYGEKPPSWSLTKGESAWTIAEQTKALLCLLGTPTISTKFANIALPAKRMDLTFLISPGFSLTGWSVIEVALYIRRDGVPTTIRMYRGSPIDESYSVKKLSSDGRLFRAENVEITIVPDPKTKEPKEIEVTLKTVAYDVNRDVKWTKDYERLDMQDDPKQGLWGTLTFESVGSGIAVKTEMQVCRVSPNGLDALKTDPSDLAEPERFYKSLS